MVSLGRDCGGPQISRITAIQTGEVLAQVDGIALSFGGDTFSCVLKSVSSEVRARRWRETAVWKHQTRGEA